MVTCIFPFLFLVKRIIIKKKTTKPKLDQHGLHMIGVFEEMW